MLLISFAQKLILISPLQWLMIKNKTDPYVLIIRISFYYVSAFAKSQYFRGSVIMTYRIFFDVPDVFFLFVLGDLQFYNNLNMRIAFLFALDLKAEPA